MRVMVLGGEGMLGHKMYQTLLQRYEDTACTVLGTLDEPFYQRVDLFQRGRVIEKVDAMDLPALDRRLAELRPENIVNCIGIVKQRKEAAAAIPSITLNSLLPHRLAAAAQRWGGRLFHISTDCVFSGRKGAYTEEDTSDAEDLYGRSKFLGEVSGAENALTLRTSIIGRELAQFQSLLEWFLAQRGKRIRGFLKVIYSGVTTNHLAGLIGRLIEEHPHLFGLYQVTSQPINKYDLLSRLREAFRVEVDITPYDQEVSDRSMRSEKFQRATGIMAPSWDVLISELADDSTPYDRWKMGS